MYMYGKGDLIGENCMAVAAVMEEKERERAKNVNTDQYVVSIACYMGFYSTSTLKSFHFLLTRMHEGASEHIQPEWGKVKCSQFVPHVEVCRI